MDEITDFLGIKTEDIYEFKNIRNLTFVFKTSIITFHDKISSCEIRPEGIIYMKNDDYFFAPLSENSNVNEIIRKYVKEEEYFHYQP